VIKYCRQLKLSELFEHPLSGALAATLYVENTSSGIKPCKGVIQFVSFDYAL
jgi:hypothetical protein